LTSQFHSASPVRSPVIHPLRFPWPGNRKFHLVFG
jgi:hypothetical protein